MKIENHFATPVPPQDTPDDSSFAGFGADNAGHRGIAGSPAFIIDLSAKAAQRADEEADEDAGPGKSAQSPAHRARALIEQFFESNAAEESPIKAFGYVVSQLAQGNTIEDIIASLSQDDETEEGDGEGAAVAASEPAPTLLDAFLEDTDESPTPTAV